MEGAGSIESGPHSIGVVTVATNRYIDYWHEMALSADRHLFPGHPVVLHVFTDRASDARAMAGDLTNVVVNPVPIEALGWPEATLLRYEVFDSHGSDLQQDLLMHLDADMLVAQDVGPELEPAAWPGGIALVRHPGYRRPSLGRRLSLYAAEPRLALSDAYAYAKIGGIGSWETDTRSRAFVPRRSRRTYVCGGTWFGVRPAFLSMVHELAVRTRADLEEGTIAVWHDESHLNWYAAGHRTAVLGSEYCFAPGFQSVKDLNPKIIAVDKADDRTR